MTILCLGIILAALGLGVKYLGWMLLADQFIIPSQSMLPTLMPGDRVLVDKTLMGARIYKTFDFDPGGIELQSWRTRGRRGIRRNDVVVFNYPEHGGRICFVINHVYCKRVIALPGDSISIAEGRFRNNNHEESLGCQPTQDLLAATPDSLVRCYLHADPLDGHIPWTIRNMEPLYTPRRGDRIAVTAREGTLYRRILEWETGGKIHCDWEKDEKSGTILSKQDKKDVAVLNRFLYLVLRHCDQYRTLKFYAHELCINKNYMSALVSTTSGTPANKWIEIITLQKIKSLLTDTDLTVYQIADRMNFPEASHLTRFFKRLTGITPNEYRRNAQAD